MKTREMKLQNRINKTVEQQNHYGEEEKIKLNWVSGDKQDLNLPYYMYKF